MIAAVQCPRCPSDAASWRPLTGISEEPPWREVMYGDIYTCKVCSYEWYYTKKQGDYFPP